MLVSLFFVFLYLFILTSADFKMKKKERSEEKRKQERKKERKKGRKREKEILRMNARKKVGIKQQQQQQ